MTSYINVPYRCWATRVFPILSVLSGFTRWSRSRSIFTVYRCQTCLDIERTKAMWVPKESRGASVRLLKFSEISLAVVRRNFGCRFTQNRKALFYGAPGHEATEGGHT